MRTNESWADFPDLFAPTGVDMWDVPILLLGITRDGIRSEMAGDS
jgi:hypothetical protein